MILNEYESKKLLQKYGINISKGYLIDNKADVYNLNNILNSIGAKYYVIKIMSSDIIHKSDSGGVILNITPNNVANEMNQMLDNVFLIMQWMLQLYSVLKMVLLLR